MWTVSFDRSVVKCQKKKMFWCLETKTKWWHTVIILSTLISIQTLWMIQSIQCSAAAKTDFQIYNTSHRNQWLWILLKGTIVVVSVCVYVCVCLCVCQRSQYRSRSWRRLGSADVLKHHGVRRVPWSTPGHLHSLFNVEVVFINYLQSQNRQRDNTSESEATQQRKNSLKRYYYTSCHLSSACFLDFKFTGENVTPASHVQVAWLLPLLYDRQLDLFFFSSELQITTTQDKTWV